MLFSYRLLSEFVDLSSTTSDELVNRLTFSGFEVEGKEALASASHLCIGKVLTCENHPDSDHLHCLRVDLGDKYGIKNIVCGAPNVRAGLKVIVALVGCELPFLHETIKKGVIRGQESEGMCCSLLELGVSKESLSESSPSLNGIEELDDDAVIGNEDVLSYLGLDDVVLDINVLPNRPDCLSYLGMAREIASLTGYKMKDIPVFEKPQGEKIEIVSETEKCPRFDILRIGDVKVKEKTSLKIQRYLMASGIRPISPIVDLGNYSMLLTGQPLNMYDGRVNQKGIYKVIDTLEGKTFTTFDKKEYTLKNGDLVVTNNDEMVCLAGIMAGDKASISSDTTDFDIEAAIFYHANIRHTCSRLGLSSPSSQLFCKERNPRMVDEALAITLSLLDEFLDSYQVKGYGSYNVTENKTKPFEFSLESLNHRLGGSYTMEEVDHVLSSYRIRREGNMIYPPIDRVDLLEQCDIEEEVFRYYGPAKLLPSLSSYPVTLGGLDPMQRKRREIREMLISQGFDEILSYTLIDEKMDSMIRVFSDKEGYKLINPMTKDHEIVRSDLLPSMLEVMDYNIAHNNPDLSLFEISNIDNPNFNSRLFLSIGYRGNTALSENLKAREYTFFDMKGVIESIMAKIGIPSTRYRLMYTKNKAFHPYSAVDVYVGKDFAGTFGRVHPSLRKDNVYLAELDLGYLLSLKGLKSKFSSYITSTMVRRDLSFKINENISYASLLSTIKAVKNTYLDHVSLFDDFIDKETESEYIGLSLYFAREDKTLTSAEIDAVITDIVKAVEQNLGLSLRGQ